MATFKISIDTPACIGCGACSATCPDYFLMEDTPDGPKAKSLKPESGELGCAKDAADVCPVTCIHIFEDDKKLI